MMRSRQQAGVLLLAPLVLLLLTMQGPAPGVHAAARAGGSRSSSVPKFTPSVPASVPFRAPTSAASPFSRPMTAASPFGKPGGISGFSYSRPGYRSTSMVLPFAAGALAGTALYSLSSNQRAYCNGVSIQCYKAACEAGMRQCSSTNGTSLVLATCPDTRFSECWQSSDTLFQCFGSRRPKHRGQDLVSYCNSPEDSLMMNAAMMNAAGGLMPRSSTQLVPLVLLPLLLVGLLAQQ